MVVSVNCDEAELMPSIAEMNQPIPVKLEDGSTIELRCSIGYAHDMKKADDSLYYVKQHGKHGCKKG